MQVSMAMMGYHGDDDDGNDDDGSGDGNGIM